MSEGRRVPRTLHPIAWWIWAIGIAVAVNRTTNPLLLVLALAVLAFVVVNRRTDAPWARAFKYYLYLGLSVIVLRIVFRSVFGSGITPTDHILFTLPHLPTPDWYAGIQIGGPVSLEATLSAATDGLRLATMLCCVGAANALPEDEEPDESPDRRRTRVRSRGSGSYPASETEAPSQATDWP